MPLAEEGPLTPIQERIIKLVLANLHERNVMSVVAAELKLDIKTVYNHMHAIRGKLGIQNQGRPIATYGVLFNPRRDGV